MKAPGSRKVGNRHTGVLWSHLTSILPWGGQLGAPFPKDPPWGQTQRLQSPQRRSRTPAPSLLHTSGVCRTSHREGSLIPAALQPGCVCEEWGGGGALERESGLEEPWSPDQSSDGTGRCTGAQPVTLPLFQPCSPLSNHGRTHCSFSSRREGASSSLVSDCLCPQGCYWSPKRAP